MSYAFPRTGRLRSGCRLRLACAFGAALFSACLALACPAASAAGPAAASPPLPGSDTGSEYRHALSLARAGRFEEALAALADLLKRFPKEQRYLYDFIAVSGWAGRDSEVLELRGRVDLDAAPPYVLETVGKAARNLHQYPLALECYRRAVSQAPQRAAARVGLALSLADGGEAADALPVLDALRGPASDSIEVLNARAYVLRVQGALLEALAVYDRVLQKDPADRTARRGRIMVTLRLGAPHLAAAMAAREPGLLAPDEREAIERDRLAVAVRWGRLTPSGREPGETRGAARELQTRLRELEAQGRGDTPAARQVRYDLVAALSELGEHEQAAAVFARLGAPDDAPAYVLKAAGQSQLALRRPEAARALLERAVREQPDDFELQLGLFYTYVDLEDFESALALIDRLAATQPAWLGGAPGERRPNPARLTADSTAALARAFADRLGAAQRRLDPLVERAPYNADLRAARAYVYLWRGWPRRALDEFRLAQTIEPHQLDARLGAAEALQAVGEIEHAAQAQRELARDYPGNSRVSELERAQRLRARPELRLETGGGTSSGTQEGSRDLSSDLWLYGPSLAYRYRLYAHHHFERARFPEGTAAYRRLGAGVEYRVRDLQLRGELSGDAGANFDPGINPGAALDALWTPTDRWSFALGLDSQTDSVPLRGRLAEGIDGRAATLGADWRAHESRRLHLGLQRAEFSDGNGRTAWSASAFQRLVTRPHYKLDGLLELFTSRNTRPGAPYFNPAQDRSIDLTLANEWILFRRYERALRQRLAVTAGDYWQRGFGAGPTWTLRAEQQWDPNPRTGLIYGVARAQRLYDGAAEHQWQLYLNLDRRF